MTKRGGGMGEKNGGFRNSHSRSLLTQHDYNTWLQSSAAKIDRLFFTDNTLR